MIFSQFERYISGDYIIFKNLVPIENAVNLVLYKETVVGTFTKKEFR
jgi:hypothetical protein